MALSAASVWEVRTTGSDNSGGGFVAGASGTDYSQQDAAQYSGTDLVIDGVTNTKVTSATHNFVAADVGNILQITAGSGFTTGFFQIVSVAANAATLDRSAGTLGSTGGTFAVGGALATIQKAATAMAGGNKVFVKATATYTTAATITLSAPENLPGTSATGNKLIGYTTTRGDAGRATIQLITNTGLTGLSATNGGWSIENFVVDCNSLGTSKGIVLNAQYSTVRNCKVQNFTSNGITLNTGVALTVVACEITGGTSAATGAILLFPGANALRNYVHDNACHGISADYRSTIINNIVDSNTGASSDGINIEYGCVIQRNTIHANGRHGINNSTQYQMGNLWLGNIITSNGGYGIVAATGALPAAAIYDGNAFWNNTSGARSNMDSTAGIHGVAPYTNVFDVILTGDPYVDAAAGDFDLNNTAGAGAAARGAGTPQTWPGNADTSSYPDMGGVQHQDPAGGGGGPVISGPPLIL